MAMTRGTMPKQIMTGTKKKKGVQPPAKGPMPDMDGDGYKKGGMTKSCGYKKGGMVTKKGRGVEKRGCK